MGDDARAQTAADATTVVDEHLDTLNRGDWNRLMAQYPDDVEIVLPDGVVIRGRQAVGDAFAGMVSRSKTAASSASSSRPSRRSLFDFRCSFFLI